MYYFIVITEPFGLNSKKPKIMSYNNIKEAVKMATGWAMAGWGVVIAHETRSKISIIKYYRPYKKRSSIPHLLKLKWWKMDIIKNLIEIINKNYKESN